MTTKRQGGALIDAIRAELIKLRTVRVPWICVGVAVVVMAMFSFAFGRISWINDAPAQPVGHAPINVLAFVQYAAVVLALQVVTTEYATGSIRTTLLAVPDRARLMLAKAILVSAVAFVLGVLLGAIGIAAAWPGFRGDAGFDISTVAVNLLAMGCYLVLIAVIALGIGAAVRSPIGALALTLMLITILPWMLQGIGGDVLTTIAEFLPQSSGGNFMLARTGTYPVGIALLITTAWAGVSYAVGLGVMRTRDGS